MGRKPRVFIGSSSESLRIARAINSNLDHNCEVTVWTQGTFKLSSYNIDSLVGMATSVDFSVFIFSPDDLSTIRDSNEKVVRDNVLFELGLFIGTIGKERCYIVKPREIKLHFPTDLIGITTTDYDPYRSDGSIESAMVYPCSQILLAIEQLGIRGVESVQTRKPIHFEFKGGLTEIDYDCLSTLLPTYTEYPGGLMLPTIKNKLNISDTRVDLSIIKLENLKYIQKANERNSFDDEYYVYTITQEGLNVLLERESNTENAIPIETDDDLPF